ncbi:hypothetical protein, unlikely [Trypanosoma brucei brucei TREU927]|uniref:Uncharacterized protein n=1 Tax=Trypanosoma brucei brucei (strain 927/4 GUTat10.1) TaxID=185431 RepID=Q4GZ76_TRYB2|nr:hypothetical protein, unlikely [Trypanosoma brucei brucei TREU927]CAJ16112.1 hypothetical protein, unlikely [Trypanosoma brucei brucei TREU927]
MPMQKYYRHISPLSYFFFLFFFFLISLLLLLLLFLFLFLFLPLIIYFICLPSTRFCTTGHSLFAPFTSLLTTMLAKIYISLFVCLFWREGEGGKRGMYTNTNTNTYTRSTRTYLHRTYILMYILFFPPPQIYIYIYICISFFFLASFFSF